MAKTDIYGAVPDAGAAPVISEAMKDLGSSETNKVNGKVNDSRDSQYDPENGK